MAAVYSVGKKQIIIQTNMQIADLLQQQFLWWKGVSALLHENVPNNSSARLITYSLPPQLVYEY